MEDQKWKNLPREATEQEKLEMHARIAKRAKELSDLILPPSVQKEIDDKEAAILETSEREALLDIDDVFER